MSSKAQKRAGYPLPEVYETDETQSFCIIIPAGEEFAQAAYAQLLMLGKWWKWKHDDDPEDPRAKYTAETWRKLFEMNEDCGGFDMTPEELTEAICNGLVCAAPRIGLMLASGKSSGNDFDEDGNIDTPAGADGEGGLPPDDPETPAINETLAAKAGGAIAVRVGINDVWKRLDTFYTTGITAASAKGMIAGLYLWNDVAQSDAIVDSYYTARAAAQPFVPSTGFAVTIDSYLYCKGITGQNILEWIIELQTANLQGMSSLINGLTQEQRDIWYNSGIEVPSLDYVGYSCTKIDDESGSHNYALSNNPQFITAGVWKPGHRFLVTFSGTATDTDNPNIVYDAFYEHNTVSGTKTWKPTTFSSNGGVPTPLQANVPFAADHNYSITVDKSPNVAAGVCTVVGDNGSAGLPNTSGIIDFDIVDLGEFAS